MTDSFMKLRGNAGSARFGRKTPAGAPADNQNRGKGRNRIPDGKFEHWWPGDTAIWLNISPFQIYKQKVYDRDSRSVIEVETTWFEYRNHYIPEKRRSFICSAGVHRTEPCYGCARRQQHWDWLDQKEKETGVRPNKAPDVSHGTQFGLGITIMETVFAVPKTNPDGSVKKKANGEPIFRYVPEPLHTDTGAAYPTSFGHRAHWSVGVEQRDQLLEWDTDLRNRCGSCAGHLVVTRRICPGCEAVVALPQPASGEDISQLRAKHFKCRDCGYADEWVLGYECPDCGEPREGGLTQFDLRIKRTKIGEKWALRLVEIRVPSSDEEVRKLMENPLNLVQIFTPDPLEAQKALLGDKAKGLDKNLGSFAKDYTSGTKSDEGSDESSDESVPY